MRLPWGATVHDSLVTGLNDPGQIAVFGGNLFVTNEGIVSNGSVLPNTRTIGEYTMSGAPVSVPLASGLDFPVGIAVYGGNLFVTNESGTIGEYTTSGSTVNASLVSGLDTPVGIAVVPEPSSLILAAFGFAGLAAWAWRRTR